MARLQLTTNVPAEVREALEKYSTVSGFKINRIVEEGILMRIIGKGALPPDLERDLDAFCQTNGVERTIALELAVRKFLVAESKG